MKPSEPSDASSGSSLLIAAYVHEPDGTPDSEAVVALPNADAEWYCPAGTRHVPSTT